MFAQINHAGSHTKADCIGQLPVAPSKTDGARALSVAEISEIEDLFVAAALRVKEAGFDGVELHSEPGYFRDMSEAVKAADLISVGRAIFRDGNWASKAMA